MKEKLAKRLVADMMSWDLERATQEFAWLELMVHYKFDDYQQYGPGNRFYVYLLRWLSQYRVGGDRECAWQLLRDELIYVTQEEMNHLVSLTGPVIEREMRAAIAKRLGIPVYIVDQDEEARRLLQEMRCRTLYVGVSDGARIDVFRRFNERSVNNEQVVSMIEISANKQKGLKKKLRKRLDVMGSTAPDTFEWVCLIDDFTASGTTSIRFDDGQWDGKVHRFLEEVALTNEEAPLISTDAHVQVHHYLASHVAMDNVTQRLVAFESEQTGRRFIPSFSYVLPQEIVVTRTTHTEIALLLEDRYDPGIETTHTGQCIALGYKNGGLPLVLYHNTPNNTVATVWARSDPDAPNYIREKHMSPLFPRRQRHSDVRP